jgi:branched-chain amino acid transport system permease protein
LAFAISGFYAGTAGALYGGMLGFVGPESFDLLQMILHKAAVVIGGLGSIIGSVIGGVLLTVSVEITKELKWSIEMAFGALLMLFVLFQPTGLVTFIKRWVPGWREHLQYLPEREAQRSIDADEFVEDGEITSTDESVQERQP